MDLVSLGVVKMAKASIKNMMFYGFHGVYEYEREQAEFNRRFGNLETILLFAEPGMESISSSLVRELKFFGRDIKEFLP